jgi:ABC-2 type transport system permease protein
LSALSAIAWRTLGDSRTRTISFALIFFIASAAQVLSYRAAYPMLEDRLKLARTIIENEALQLLYGDPRELLTVGGYASWRLGALAIFAGLFGVFAAVRALRAEEDSGRQELVLSGVVSRRAAYLAALTGIAAGALILWLALFAGIAVGRPGLAGSAYLALALVSPVPVFVGVGALASQLAPTRRLALTIGLSVLAAALLLRMVADTTELGRLRWTTPLGWAEELRPFADPRPAVLLLPALATSVLLVTAGWINGWRDVGAGLLAARETSAPRRWLLSSPIAFAVRTLAGAFVAWFAVLAVFAVILGVVADLAVDALSDSLREQLEKFGTGVTTPAGYLGLVFVFFIFAVCLFVCFQLGAAREEEAEQRLETLLALPVGRVSWLAGRLLVAVAGAALLAFAAGALSWAGAVSQGADVSFWRLLEAGLNCLPVALLFLGLGALAYAVAPRYGVTIAYGLVGVAFLWYMIGELLEAPGWLLGLSPFNQVGLVPAEEFRAGPAAVMLAIGIAAAVGALWRFRSRDLVGP